MNIWLHNCPRVDDSYGPQAVEKGKPCPLCGKEEEQIEITDESRVFGMDCRDGRCEF